MGYGYPNVTSVITTLCLFLYLEIIQKQFSFSLRYIHSKVSSSAAYRSEVFTLFKIYFQVARTGVNMMYQRRFY